MTEQSPNLNGCKTDKLVFEITRRQTLIHPYVCYYVLNGLSTAVFLSLAPAANLKAQCPPLHCAPQPSPEQDLGSKPVQWHSLCTHLISNIATSRPVNPINSGMASRFPPVLHCAWQPGPEQVEGSKPVQWHSSWTQRAARRA